MPISEFVSVFYESIRDAFVVPQTAHKNYFLNIFITYTETENNFMNENLQ